MHLEFQPNRPRDPSVVNPYLQAVNSKLQTVSLTENWQFMREDHCPSWELPSSCG